MQVSPKLRLGERGYFHYCPACLEMHILPHAGWTFNGDVNKPTFHPSHKHSGGRFTKTGGSELFVCHYNLIDGVLHFHGDSTHSMRGSVPLPDLPPEYQDP